MKKILKSAIQIVKVVKARYFDDFIFIHINKTGGSSIEKALILPFEHKTALEKIEEIGRKNWDRRLSFCVVRNPWDKVVSHYHYRVQTNQTNMSDKPIVFKEWVKRTYGIQDPQYYDNPKMFMPQLNWISDESGKILIDEVIYFENLAIEFNVLLKSHRIKNMKNLPHVKRSGRKNYRNYYDEETIEIVEKWFIQDIKRFGYQF